MNVIHRHMTEAQLQERVITMARLFGWRVHHSRPARRGDGSWSTPIQGDRGFPDLVFARQGRVIFAELKSETGRLGASQVEWIEALGGTTWDEWMSVFVWRPSDLPEIEAVLR